MSELGRRLAEARTAKGLSLADVESITRIRQKWLEALENGEYSKLPRGAVARGFLRTYAAYLGLDVQSTLNLYVDESGDSGDRVFMAEPGKPRLIDYRPLEVELIDDQPDSRWVAWLVALIVVVALAAGAWWFLSRNPGWNPLAALAPPLSPTSTATRTATAWVVTATPRATVTPPSSDIASGGETAPVATSDILPLPTPTVPASPSPTPRPTATPEVVGSAINLEPGGKSARLGARGRRRGSCRGRFSGCKRRPYLSGEPVNPDPHRQRRRRESHAQRAGSRANGQRRAGGGSELGCRRYR